MDVFSLVAKLTLDSSEYDQNLDESGKKASDFGDKLKTAMKVGGLAIGAVTTAATALTGAMVKGAGDVASYGDNIDKMSQKLGMSSDAYQEWDAIMRHSGTTIESMQAGMKTLASAAETGSEAFDRLGISQEQLAEMSQEELFSATITALQNMTDETERTYVAGQLLGRGATELGALLNTSAEETEAMRKRVHELGGVMSNEAVKAAAAYQDSLQDLQTVITGLKNQTMAEFLPAITTVMDGLTELFSGDPDSGIQMINDGVDSFVEQLADTIPRVLEIGADIVLSLAKAVSDNLPKLAKAATDAILTIVNGLIGMLPDIFKAGVKILTELVKGISDSLPKLIPAAVDAVLQIVDTLLDPKQIEEIFKAAAELIINLGVGLVNAIPRLLERVPEILERLLDTFSNYTADFEDIGESYIGALAAGIKTALASLVNIFSGVTGAGKTVANKALESMGLREVMDALDNATRGGRGFRTGSNYDRRNRLNETNNAIRNIVENAEEADKDIDDLTDRALSAVSGTAGAADNKLKENLSALQTALDSYEGSMEEIAGKAEEIWANIDALEEAYQESLKNRAAEIFNTYSLFEKVPERQEVSGQELIDNLQGQIAAIEDFYSGLQTLAERGVGEDLVEDIRAMGPNALDQLTALLELSDDKLDEYAELYGEKQKLANEIATDELAGLREETDVLIQENIDSLNDLLTQEMPEVGLNYAQKLAEGIEFGIDEIVAAAEEAGREAVAAWQRVVGTTYGRAGTGSVEFADSAAGRSSAATANAVSAAAESGGEVKVEINFAGSMAQLGRVLQPVVKAETERVGSSMVNVGA